jgi:hypothetical protein
MAIAPNLGAGTVDNPPIKLPIGVLTAETITTFVHDIYNISLSSKFNHFKTNFDFHLSIIFFLKYFSFYFKLYV